MGIRFICPNGHKLNVKEHLAGKKGLCPHCGSRFYIPHGDSDKPAAEISATGSADVASTVPPTEAGNSSIRGTGLMPPVGPAARASKSGISAAATSAATASSAAAAPAAANPASAAPQAAAPTAAAAPVAGAPAPAAPTIAPAPAAAPDPIAEAPDATWYMRLPTGDQYGPAPAAEMRSWLDQNRVPADALVWRDTWADWKRADEAFPALAAPSPALAAPVIAAPAAFPGVQPGLAAPGMPMPGLAPGMPMAPAPVPGFPMPGAPVAAVGFPAPGAPVATPGFPMPGAPLGVPMAAGFPGAAPMAPVPGFPVPGMAPGAAMGAMPVAMAAPVAGPVSDPDTGEFFAQASGQPRRAESTTPLKKKGNAGAIIVTVVMILLTVALGAVAYFLIMQEKGYDPVVVANPQLGLQFAFPKEPTVGPTPPKMPSPVGDVIFTSREASGGGYTFFAVMADVSKAEKVNERKDEVLSYGAQIAARRIEADSAVSGREVRVAGSTGREYTASAGGKILRARVYVINNFLVVLGLFAGEDKNLKDGMVAKQFFESIKSN